MVNDGAVPNPVEYRDGQGRTFAEYVADRIMAAVIADGRPIQQLAEAGGINRETLRRRISLGKPFTTVELGQLAFALEIHPAELINAAGFEPASSCRQASPGAPGE